MINILVMIPVAVFACYFWFSVGRWAYLNGRTTCRKAVQAYRRLLSLKDTLAADFKKQA